jgi:PncC family amidohydrolase
MVVHPVRDVDDQQISAKVADVAEALLARGLTVAVAESCTGGLLGAYLTERGGASRYFVGGAITYTNHEKTRAVGVDGELLAQFGAVSEACAWAMARGVRARTGASFGVSVTGVAGPGSDAEGNSVGTVWVGVDGAENATTRLLRLGDRDRTRIRALAVWYALDTLLTEVTWANTRSLP